MPEGVLGAIIGFSHSLFCPFVVVDTNERLRENGV